MEAQVNELSGGLGVSVSSRNKETMLLPEHIHDYFELYYLHQGSARHFVENDIISLKHGEFVFIAQNAIHKTVYDAGKYSKRVLIDFTQDYIGEAYKDVLDELGAKKYLSLPINWQPVAEEIILRLCKEYGGNEKLHAQLCRALLQELIILLHRHAIHRKAAVLTETEQSIQSAAKYISEHYSDELNLSYLATMYSMSNCYFSRTFKQFTGFGVSEYINIIRIQQAEQMLCTGGLSVRQVANACGFNDSNYFAAVFKRHKGITPLKFSAMHKQV